MKLSFFFILFVKYIILFESYVLYLKRYALLLLLSIILLFIAAKRMPLPTLFGIKFHPIITFLRDLILMHCKVLSIYFPIRSPQSGMTLSKAEIQTAICTSSRDGSTSGVETCVLYNDSSMTTAIWTNQSEQLWQTSQCSTNSSAVELRHNTQPHIVQFCWNWELRRSVTGKQRQELC